MSRQASPEGDGARLSEPPEQSRAGLGTLLRESADWRALKRSPYGLMPVVILTGIFIFRGFDADAFTLLVPEIVKSLDLEVSNLLNLLNLLTFFLIFALIAVAYFADRFPRTPMVGISTVMAGIFTIFTSRAGSLLSLGFSRSGDITGKAVTIVPASSLVADYYPPEVRGKAFAAFGTLTRTATLFAPLIIPLIVARSSWRTPFFVIGTFAAVMGVLALIFLREPVRGYMERKAMGASEEVAKTADESPSLGEAWRTTWSIRTLRRLFISDIFGGAADQVYRLFFVIFLFQYYGLTLRERGLLAFAAGVFALAGGFLGGGLVDALTRRRPQRVLTLLGAFSLLSSLVFAAITAGPPIGLLYVTFCAFGFFSALQGPATGVVYAQIVPPNVRSVGLAIQNLALVPAVILNGFVINVLFERWGPQGALSATVPLLIVSAFIQLSAAGFFQRDMRAALAAALAAEEWRSAKRSGAGKLLVCRDVDVEYEGVQVLFGVDFDVEEGEIIALLGTNGAGKSTLLRAISGTQEASSGAIVFDGRDITHMPTHEIAARGVVHMPGGRGIFPGLTVRENLLLGNWLTPDEEARPRLEEVLSIFPVLRERAEIKAGTLSGGEQQMVSLAQAFLSKPRLLMIDELSLGLSPAVVSELVAIVRRIRESGVTVIIVEQSINVALALAERAIFMEKGEVRFVGRTKDLLDRPEILRAVYVKGAASLGTSPGSGQKTERELRQYELGHASSVLSVSGVSKRYGGVKAVDNVSFELREGEALGLIGPNGAGKTSLFEIISGFQSPDEGTITFKGIDVTQLDPEERSRRGLVRRFQDARLFPSLTVYENILTALDRRLDTRNIVLTSLQVPQARQAERRIRRRADRMIDLLELGAYRDKLVKELSTGLRRITDIACVLASEPKVLLLDEPSTGIAQSDAEELGPLLRRVRAETGCTMLVIEHDIPLISRISDELIAMHQGGIIARGTPDDVLDSDLVIESYLGVAEDQVRGQVGAR